jgi:hypothetical protein
MQIELQITNSLTPSWSFLRKINVVSHNTRALLLIGQSVLTHIPGEAISVGGPRVQAQGLA